MLKPYREQFTSELNQSVRIHPSTKTFAFVTKNILGAHFTSALALLAICIFNGLVPTSGGAAVGLVGVIWIAYTSTTLIRAPFVMRRYYNDYLYPIEVAFNKLTYKDQKKHKEDLKRCYQIAARGEKAEFDELTKVRELFEMSVPEEEKILSVDEQLEIKRAELKKKQEEEKRMQDILDELNREHGI